jgi:hypothetical protein
MPDNKDQAQANLAKITLKPGQRFRHYKRDGIYEIVTLAVKEDTLEPLVIYHSLTKGSTWVRTYADWNAEVEVEGKKVKRFQAI